MFGKLREKLKAWTRKVSDVENEISDIRKEKPSKEIKKEKEEFKEAKKRKVDPEERKIGDKLIKDIKKEEQKKESRSFIEKIFSSKKEISEDQFETYSEELEMILLENNVALEVSEKIIKKLKEEMVGKEIEKKEIEGKIYENLKNILDEILVEPFEILKEIKEKKGVYTILFCGINGAGKTTTIAKFAKLLEQNKIKCVLGAADTFRAASIEQLKKHGEKLEVPVIAHNYGADPAAVGFDTIKYAEKNNIKVALIDTAGRMHTAKNLLREMEKIKRVTKPDRTIFLGESITGNDSTDQIKAFHETIGIDGIILSKADIDEKGGTALSVGYTTGKPILFLGTGQNYEDLEPFNKKKFIEKLGL